MKLKTNKVFNIAIFSGEIPSTTFIEHLVEGVSQTHNILLFGVRKSKKNYINKNIKVYNTPKSHIKNFCISLYRVLILLANRPRDFITLFTEIKSYKSVYDKWIWFTKFLPIILYKPDVFHMQWARDMEFYTFLKTRYNIPIVLSFRGAHINYTPIIEPNVALLYKRTFTAVNQFHAVSNAIAKEALKYGNIKKRTQVIHSPIPQFFINAFLPYTKKEASQINIVSVGRFHWIKGFNYALEALALLKAKGYDVHYTIVGPSKFTEAIAFQINQLQITDQVSLKGNLQQNELISFLHTQDLMLLSSVDEGIANVILEAMAIGLPVVSTDCGGMGEVVIPNETGWLVPKRNVEAIAEAVIEVKECDTETLNKMIVNAHEYVKLHFNYKDNITAFINLYAKVIDKNPVEK